MRLLSLFMLGGGSIRDVADAAAAVLFYVVYFTVTRRHLCAQHFESRDKFPFGDNKVQRIREVSEHSCPPPGQLGSPHLACPSVQALFDLH